MTIDVPATSALVSSMRIDLPFFDSRLDFNFADGNSLHKRLFLSPGDGSLIPQRNKSTTACSELGCFGRRYADANVVIVNIAESAFAIEPTTYRIPLDIANTKIIAHLRMSASGKIQITDPEQLAREYAFCQFSPTDRVAESLREAIEDMLQTEIRTLFCTLGDGFCRVNELQAELGRQARIQTQYDFGWCRVSNCRVSLAVENEAEIMAAVKAYIDQVMTMVQQHLGRCLENEITTVLTALIQSNPGISAEELAAIGTMLQDLYPRTTPEVLMDVARQIISNPHKLLTD